MDIYCYEATVRRCYDGDSVILDIRLGLGIWALGVRCRLLYINAPEIRGAERPLGLKAKAVLALLAPPGSKVMIKTDRDRRGKYGRLLVELLDNREMSINRQMVETGHAVYKDY